jgi:hypothetical protein
VRTAIRMTRTRKAVIVLTVALASTVGILVHAVPPAFAASCFANTQYVAGGQWFQVPPVGTTEGLYINLEYTARSGGNIRAFIRDTNSLGDTLVTGIIVDGDGARAYIEYNGSFKGQWPISYATNYHFWITHDSPADFTAHAAGFGSYQGIVHSSSTYDPEMDLQSTSNSGSSGTCNQYYFDFSGLEPWTISTPNLNTSWDVPYTYTKISNTEFVTELEH